MEWNEIITEMTNMINEKLEQSGAKNRISVHKVKETEYSISFSKGGNPHYGNVCLKTTQVYKGLKFVGRIIDDLTRGLQGDNQWPE